uniref:Uncharacterized protein n=1 Tax=Bionectria ochroleuca TaxID=29856 RepID=A0A0B7K284_BIOOC
MNAVKFLRVRESRQSKYRLRWATATHSFEGDTWRDEPFRSSLDRGLESQDICQGWGRRSKGWTYEPRISGLVASAGARAVASPNLTKGVASAR